MFELLLEKNGPHVLFQVSSHPDVSYLFHTDTSWFSFYNNTSFGVILPHLCTFVFASPNICTTPVTSTMVRGFFTTIVVVVVCCIALLASKLMATYLDPHNYILSLNFMCTPLRV